MTDGIQDLSVLHEVPYSNIKGAYVKVKQETTDYAAPVSERRESVTTEIREGTIVGRGNGQGVAYDRVEKVCRPISIGPAIYIETPEDTVLELRTDKQANELLEFKQDNE